MEPSYAKPDAALNVPASRVKADKNVCVIGRYREPNARYFVRALVPFEVYYPPSLIPRSSLQRHWGIWTEVSHETFEKVLDLWNNRDVHGTVRRADDRVSSRRGVS